MTDAAQPASRPLAEFIRALRASEVAVSPAEAIEAHKALVAVGFDDRAAVRDALAATLAKSAEETARFDTCFDTFFARARLNEAGLHQEAAGAADLESLLTAGDAVGVAEAMEAAADRVGAGQIQLATQRALLTRRLLDDMGLRGLESRIQALRDLGDGESAERLANGRVALFVQARAFVDRQERLYAAESGRRLREQILARQAFSAIEDSDVRAMERLVRRMARRLAMRYARQRRRAQVGRLDVRHTLRRSLPHGGVPFDLAWKHRKIGKPRIVAVCDVSRSVAAAAQFLLLFLHCLNEVVDKLESFAFSDRLARVDDLLDEASVDDAITLILARIGFRPTNYGRALEDLLAPGGASLDRRTTVIILGDGRSNYAEPRLDLMRALSERVRQVIWLNPEPRAYWGQGDSKMDAYARFCRLAKTCNTLEGLERVIDNVLATHLPR